MKLKLFIIFVISCSLALINCDIPTHCLQHQIVGNWVFYQTEAVPKNLAELYQHKCGIKDHTKVSEIQKFNMDKSLFKNSFEISLNVEHKAKITKSFEGLKGSKVISLFLYLFIKLKI